MNLAEIEAIEQKERIVEDVYNNQIEAHCGQILSKLYPGYRWYVEAKIKAGIVTIQNQTLGGEKGYVLPISKVINETDGNHLVMVAGGEILERHGLARGPRRVYADEIKRDGMGVAIGETEETP
jgi:hypothetical protein